MQVIVDHQHLQGLRQFVLATKDAYGLYSQTGFTVYSDPERLMTWHNPNIYKTVK